METPLFIYLLIPLIGFGAGALLLRFPPTKLLAPIKGFLNEQGDAAPHFIMAPVLIFLAVTIFLLDERPVEMPVGADKTATTTIESRLVGKSSEEKASLKGQEIAKIATTFKERAKHGKADYEIEIQDINAIDGGVEVFARAWTPEGKPVGFGVDGTVEIERFLIYNPPVLVDDPLGDIVRTWTNERTGATESRTLREDPKAALLQTLAHTVSVVGKDGENISPGKRGNTTSTFFAGSGDGQCGRVNRATWTDARNTATAISCVTTETLRELNAEDESAGANDFNVTRLYFPFDTSALPDTDTVSSATFSFSVENVGSGDRSTGLIQTSQTSPTALAVGDYDAMTINSPAEGATRISVSSTGYQDMTLNATGLSWISKTSYTLFGTRMAFDIDNHTPSFAVDGRNHYRTYQSEQTGTTNDPKLVVEHSAAATEATPQDIIFYQ